MSIVVSSIAGMYVNKTALWIRVSVDDWTVLMDSSNEKLW